MHMDCIIRIKEFAMREGYESDSSGLDAMEIVIVWGGLGRELRFGQ